MVEGEFRDRDAIGLEQVKQVNVLENILNQKVQHMRCAAADKYVELILDEPKSILDVACVVAEHTRDNG